MKITFGKYDGKTLEQILLTDPAYVRQILSVSDPDDDLKAVIAEAWRMIELFEAKPLTGMCYKINCGKAATRIFLYIGSPALTFWCDKCDPYSRGATQGKLREVKEYLDVEDYVARYFKGRKSDLQVIFRAVLEAKEGPKPVTERAAKAFFS
ncbi:hypothetical protein [Alienimonas chondri]|uniref:Exodeoxyribonuclease X-like C-terminal domain-containing protein n=1 Tax=Alienimonas chondri TaxID=2681879 RepID=A0ABX1VAN6_9PLAN|nr:hypothetical protein [Alienimonas chondri]NNJ24347.1 hypothetical protein [Alienimonas chondri]